MNKLWNSMLLGQFLCIGIATLLIFINFFLLQTIPNTSALQSWSQETDTDFKNGKVENLTVKGTGANALLELCSVEVNSWTNAAPTNKPSARQSHAMAGIYNDDNVLLFGGYDDTGWKDDTWVYNVSEDQWHYKSTKNKPPARSEHAMATVYNDDKVLLFGGNNATERKNDTWVYDASDNDWTQKFPKNAPSARNYHAIASIYNDDKILLFGGEDGTGKKDDTWVYDLSDNSWTQKLQTDKPSGRIYHTMATVYNDDKVVLFGGLDSTYKDDTWVYDLSNNEWKEKPQINKPPARIRHAMASFYNDDKVVLFGGSDAPGAKNDTWIYDLSEEEGNGKWEQKTQANEPSARQSHAMATVYNDDKVVLFGGYNATLYKRKDDTWVYNLSVYVPFGFFQSEYKDTGGSSNFVKINWNATVPTSTSLKFQIRTSDTQSNLSSENFFGPNGTTNSYYTSSGTIIWSGHKGDRWLQYKAYFSTTNLDKTPILNDVTVKYNIIPLEPTPISPANAQWLNNSKPTFSWKFNDADGTQEEYNVQIDNDLNFGSIDYTSNNISSSESSWTPMNPISDGIWYWRVRTKDNDGDWSDYNKDIWCLKIDTTPPKTNHTIVSGILGNNDWYKSDVKLELSSMDEGSGVYEIKYKINFGDWQKYTTQFTVSGDRKNIVSYYAIDNVGNMEEKNISIKIDTTAPISNHNISGILGDNDWYKSDVQLTLSSVDETSGVEEIKYKLNDGNWEIYTSPFLIFNEGKNVINYYAIDNAGNVETEKNTSFKIDKKAPYLEIIEPANGTITNNDVMLIYSVSDNFDKSDEINVSIRNETKYSDEKKHEITIIAKDKAGNEAINKIEFTIDKTKPMTNDDIKIGWQKYKPIIIALEAKDNLSGIKNTYYKVWLNGTDEPKNWNIGNEINVSEDGKWLIKYYSIDNAGNEEEIKIKELWIDTKAPDKPVLNIIKVIGNSILLAWNETTEQNFERYEIHISTKEDFSIENVINIIDKKTVNYTVKNLKIGKYYLKLEVIDEAGWKSETEVSSIKIQPVKEINWLLIFAILLLLTLFTAVGIKLRKRKKAVEKVVEEKFAVEEVFLIYNDGRLISHTTRRLKADMDEEIFSSMLTAVRTFIKDSFGKEEKGELTSMQYADNRILFERGKNTILAVVITGEEPTGFIEEMKTTMNNIESEYGIVLKDWDGELSKLSEVKKFLTKLGEYKITEEEKIKAKVKIMAELEFYRGFVRLKAAVKNSTEVVITDATLKIIYDENALRLDHIEPEYSIKGNDIIIGNVSANEKKTIAIYLDPKICMESYIDATLSFKDHKGNLEIVKMKRKLVSVVCPIIYTDENINVPMLKRMIDEELEQRDSKLFLMPNLEHEKVSQVAKRAIQRHDVRAVREFFEKEPYSAEIWYYGKTKERKDKIVIRASVREDSKAVEFFVASNSILVVTGLLAELRKDFMEELKNEKTTTEQITDEKIINEITKKRKLIEKSADIEIPVQEVPEGYVPKVQGKTFFPSLVKDVTCIYYLLHNIHSGSVSGAM